MRYNSVVRCRPRSSGCIASCKRLSKVIHHYIYRNTALYTSCSVPRVLRCKIFHSKTKQTFNKTICNQCLTISERMMSSWHQLQLLPVTVTVAPPSSVDSSFLGESSDCTLAFAVYMQTRARPLHQTPGPAFLRFS